MSAATEAVGPSTAPAEHVAGDSVSEQSANPSSSAAAALDSATTTAATGTDAGGRDHIERDVSNILAGLNQEQLASIVAAARASEARTGTDGAPSSDPAPFGDGLQASLGQAASALTSIASGFKRTAGKEVDSGKDEGDAPPPPGTAEMDADTTAATIAAVKSATDNATAAAIASLAHLQQPPSSTPSLTHPDADESLDYDSGSPSRGSPLKRPRGPELDRQRKDNHKEVERRRRSAINEGITQLSHIVPGCDAKNTNKGAIINAAVRYIQDLKHNEASNIEKWTLEKLLMDQAMGDLNQQLEEARAQVERLRNELDQRFADEHQEGQQGAEGEAEAGKA